MKLFTLVFFCIIAVSGCKTMDNMPLFSTAKNQYWYDGQSYEYNEYQIFFTSEPVPGRILLNGDYIGTTPCNYIFSGKLELGDMATMAAVPIDDRYKPQKLIFNNRDAIPRSINFKFLE